MTNRTYSMLQLYQPSLSTAFQFAAIIFFVTTLSCRDCKLQPFYRSGINNNNNSSHTARHGPRTPAPASFS